MRAAIVASITIAVGPAACKTDDAKRAPRTSAPVSSAPLGAPPVAAPDAALAAHDDAPVDLARVEELEPSFDDATVLSPPRLHQADQARQTWCIAGDDAAAIATAMARELTATGWTDVDSRGTPARAGTSGRRAGVRISISIGGRDARCTGLVATAQYRGATVTVPALAPGERIH